MYFGPHRVPHKDPMKDHPSLLSAPLLESPQGLPNREAWESVVATIHNETDEERKAILDQQVNKCIVVK